MSGEAIKLATWSGGLAVEKIDDELKISIEHPWTGLTVSARIPWSEAESIAEWIGRQA